MRVRFIDDSTDNFIVLDIGMMRLEDTTKYGKCVIINPMMAACSGSCFYCNDKDLTEVYYDNMSSRLVEYGYVNLSKFRFKWTSLFMLLEEDNISLKKEE